MYFIVVFDFSCNNCTGGSRFLINRYFNLLLDEFWKLTTNKVDEVEINNNYYQNNNYSNVNNNNLLELPAPSSPGLRRWQR